MKKKIIFLTAACALLILTASAGTAFAYFSTYEKALGGYTLHLGDYEEYTEEFKDWTKRLVVTNKESSYENVFVRAKAFAGSEVSLKYIADESWTPASDGYYYYNGYLKPGQSTSELQVKITGIPQGVDAKSFNVILIYESCSAKYTADGTPYADWTEKVQATYVNGGERDE